MRHLRPVGLRFSLPWQRYTSNQISNLLPSRWWQLISLAPVVGVLVLLYLLSQPTKTAKLLENYR